MWTGLWVVWMVNSSVVKSGQCYSRCNLWNILYSVISPTVFHIVTCKRQGKWSGSLLKLLHSLSLISTHTLRLSAAKVFVWDLRWAEKPIVWDKKISSFRSHLKFKYILTSSKFSYSETNQTSLFSRIRHFMTVKRFYKMAAPQLDQA